MSTDAGNKKGQAPKNQELSQLLADMHSTKITDYEDHSEKNKGVSAGFIGKTTNNQSYEPLAKRFSFCLKNYFAKNFWFLRPILYLKHYGI